MECVSFTPLRTHSTMTTTDLPVLDLGILGVQGNALISTIILLATLTETATILKVKTRIIVQ